MKTFDIVKEMTAIQELIEAVDYNEETGEIIDNSETVKALLEELELSKNDKLDNIEYMKREYKAAAETLQGEIKRLTERKAMMLRNVERLADLQGLLLQNEGTKTDKFTFFYGTSTSVDVVDEDALPHEFLAIKYTPDKKAIGDKMKLGFEVDGCKLVTKTSLRVK